MSVYWITAEDNVTAQKLYDSYNKRDAFTAIPSRCNFGFSGSRQSIAPRPFSSRKALAREKGLLPKKAVMGRERRGMRRLQHQMPGLIDKGGLALGIGAPEHEDDRRVLLVVTRAMTASVNFLPALA